MDNTITRYKFKVLLEADSSLTREQIYRILDEHFDALITKGAGVTMYRYDLPRNKEASK